MEGNRVLAQDTKESPEYKLGQVGSTMCKRGRNADLKVAGNYRKRG